MLLECFVSVVNVQRRGHNIVRALCLSWVFPLLLLKADVAFDPVENRISPGA
uniref:Uncharacterized protein n=1 Tax=Anguilla anguilla TaxID=7936 RepID=A0A0E9ST80_ANGAN